MNVAADQPLMEAGLDSLGAVELRNALKAVFGAELPPTMAIDYPTPAAMAQFLSGASHIHAMRIHLVVLIHLAAAQRAR